MKYIVFPLLLLTFSFNAGAHKFYMSITNMNYNEESGSLEISMKFFTDDIEAAVENDQKGRLFLGTEKEDKNAKKRLQEYLKDKFTINQKTIDDSSFLGFESDYDYTYCYFEIKDFRPTKNIEIWNSALIESFQDQVNKINFTYKQKTISRSCSKAKPAVEFESTYK